MAVVDRWQTERERVHRRLHAWLVRKGVEPTWVAAAEDGREFCGHEHVALHCPPRMRLALTRFLHEVVTGEPWRSGAAATVLIGGWGGGMRTSPGWRAGWAEYLLGGMHPDDAAVLGIRPKRGLRPLSGRRISITANLRAPARAAAGWRGDAEIDRLLAERLPPQPPRRRRRHALAKPVRKPLAPLPRPAVPFVSLPPPAPPPAPAPSRSPPERVPVLTAETLTPEAIDRWLAWRFRPEWTPPPRPAPPPPPPDPSSPIARARAKLGMPDRPPRPAAPPPPPVPRQVPAPSQSRPQPRPAPVAPPMPPPIPLPPPEPSRWFSYLSPDEQGRAFLRAVALGLVRPSDGMQAVARLPPPALWARDGHEIAGR